MTRSIRFNRELTFWTGRVGRIFIQCGKLLTLLIFVKTVRHVCAPLMLLALISACNQVSTSRSPTSMRASPFDTPTPTLTELQLFQQMSGIEPNITLDDNGTTFTFVAYKRFMVFLDNERHPRNELRCIPQGIIGYVSNGDLWGPDSYPIMFEGNPGTCLLVNRDFQAKIIVVMPTPLP